MYAIYNQFPSIADPCSIALRAAYDTQRQKQEEEEDYSETALTPFYFPNGEEISPAFPPSHLAEPFYPFQQIMCSSLSTSTSRYVDTNLSALAEIGERILVVWMYCRGKKLYREKLRRIYTIWKVESK